jgi:subtilisin family serine protease
MRRNCRLLLLLTAVIVALCVSVPAAVGATPNDPSFSLQWATSNLGQSIPTQEPPGETLGPLRPGTPGDDDGALRAWGITTGSRSIVIGEVDTGVDYNHPDLAANIWSNPGGVGGCAAGTHGYNVLSHTCDPMDEDTTYGGHGTHVAGIMGAMGDNGIGVAGINWQTTILPVKWLQNASQASETSALIEALQWLVAAKQAGVNVRVVNDSDTFFGTTYSGALEQEIEVLGANNILFVTAAGNTGNDNDEVAVQRYPCSYDLPNEICVTASNDNDELPIWANYGPHTVNLAAPGVSIYSTLREGSYGSPSEGEYGYLSGGSMASPQVAGAAALILSAEPTLSATELKTDILDNVEPVPSLSGKLITGGELNICKALPGCEHVTTEQPTEQPVNKEAPESPSTSQEVNKAPSPSADPEAPRASTPGTPSSTGAASGASTGAASGAVSASKVNRDAVALLASNLAVEDGRMKIRLRCTGLNTCQCRLTVTVETKGRHETGTTETSVRTIGAADFSISPGQTATIGVKLNATGRALLNSAYGKFNTSQFNASLTILTSSPGQSWTEHETIHLSSRKAARRGSPRDYADKRAT